MKPEKQLEIGYYTRTLNGHRKSYLDFVKKQFGGKRVEGFALVSSKHPVLFLMIEDNFLLYFVVGCIRAILCRKTIGLLFRPKPALQASNFRLKLKLGMLKFLKKIQSVTTFSIIPTTLDPEISTIADDWIYDFQLWDITPAQRAIFHKIRNIELNTHKKYEISNEVRLLAKGKKILISLGVQNKGKGIHVLSENINKFNQENYFVVVAGCFDKKSFDQRNNLKAKNALVFDRFMTDEEILALYSVADAVWCYYDPAYDQASGILGRAVQLGVLPIVRPESFSEKFCLAEGIPHVAIYPHKHEKIFLSLEQQSERSRGDRNIQEKLKRLSENKLNKIFASKSGI